MSVPCKSSPAALQLLHPCRGACLFGWLAMAFLGRACGNTCETAIIMAFLSEGVGVEVAGVFSPPLHMSRRKLCAVTIFSRAFSTWWTRHRRVERQLSSRV